MATNRKPFKIVVLGKRGVGKSSFVNGLVGERVAPEEKTRNILKYEFQKNNALIQAIDTPGFDTVNNYMLYNNKIADAVFKATNKDVDLVVLCFDIRSKVPENEVEIFMKNKLVFKSNIAGTPLLAILTHANEVDASDLQHHIKKCCENIQKFFHVPLWERLNRKPYNISAVPAGYDAPNLPGSNEDWVSGFWQKALNTGSSVITAQPQLLTLMSPSPKPKIISDTRPKEISDTDLKKVEEWLKSGSKELNIIVIGKLGVGKSMLVNGLFGADVVKVGAGATATSDAVRKYKMTKKDISIAVFDTPGFDDPERKDEETVAEMLHATDEKIDLVLICFNICRPLGRSELSIFNKLISFKDWKRVLIVLTFSNEISSPANLTEKINECGSVLRDHLVDPNYGNLSKYIAKNIPVIPAGFKDPDLPCQKDWLSNLWQNAFFSMNNVAKPSFIKLAEGRTGRASSVQPGLPQERLIFLGVGDSLIQQIKSAIIDFNQVGRFIFNRVISQYHVKSPPSLGKTIPENAQYLAAYHEALTSKKSLNMLFGKMTLVGPPGLGKTTLRRRLAGEIIDITSAGEKKQPSTGIAESSQIIIRELSSSSIAITHGEWSTTIDLSDEAHMFLEFCYEASTKPEEVKEFSMPEVKTSLMPEVKQSSDTLTLTSAIKTQLLLVLPK